MRGEGFLAVRGQTLDLPTAFFDGDFHRGVGVIRQDGDESPQAVPAVCEDHDTTVSSLACRIRGFNFESSAVALNVE